MKRRRTLSAILRFLRNVLFVDLGIAIVIGLICWFGGWRTAFHYGNGLLLAGVAAIVLGVYSLRGSSHLTRQPGGYQYAGSAGTESMWRRTRREMKDIGPSYAFLALMSVAGIVSIAAGILILITLV